MDDNDYEPYQRRGLFASLKEFCQKFFTPISLASFMVSLAIYAYQFNLAIAFGLVVLILIHEAGHAVASFYYDADFSSPIFIPFIGAYVNVDISYLTGWERSIVNLAGPVFGGLGSLAFLIIGFYYGQWWMLATAEIGFFMNLMNMLPLGGLDGRKICAEVHDECWIVGLILVGVLMYTADPGRFWQLGRFLLFFFLISYGYQDPPISSTRPDRVGIFGLYLLTAILLAVGDIWLIQFIETVRLQG